MVEEVGIKRGYFWTRSTIDKDAVEDVHSDDLIMQAFDVALWCCFKQFAVVLETYSFASKDSVVTIRNSHDVELQSQFLLQLFLLLMYLLQEASANSSYTTNEEVKHLVLREEEAVVNHIECFAKEVLLDDERDVCLASTLSTSNHANTRATKRSKEFACDTRRVLHVLANNSDCC